MILHNFCWLLEKALTLRLKSSMVISLGKAEGEPQLKAEVRQDALILNFQLTFPRYLAGEPLGRVPPASAPAVRMESFPAVSHGDPGFTALLFVHSAQV